MTIAGKKSLLLGVRIFAVVVASTTVLNHRAHDKSTKDLNIVDSGKDVNFQNSIAESWQGKIERAAGPPPKFNRRKSFAGSVASTESTKSIMTYVRNLQNKVRPYQEKDLYFIITPRRASFDQAMNLDIADSSPPNRVVAIQNRTLDGQTSLDTDSKLQTSETSNDPVISLVEVRNDDSNEDDIMTLHTNINLAPVLYTQSTALFKSLAPLIARSPEFSTSSRTLLGDLGKLHVWGATFDGEQMTAILAESEILRSTILGLTFTLSKVLVENILPSLGQSYSKEIVEGQVVALITLLQHTEKQLFGEIIDQSTSDDDASTDGADYSIEDATLIIRSSVDSLMGLLPTMERIIASLNLART